MDDLVYETRSQSREQVVRGPQDRIEPGSTSPQNTRRQRGPSQKVMLSKALQKANTAVLLDNAANFEGAIEAYQDACQLLQLVMLRSSGGDDEKSKLLEIRNTYVSRIKELERLDLPMQQYSDKALPERPLSDQSLIPPNSQSVTKDEKILTTKSTSRETDDYTPPITDINSVKLPENPKATPISDIVSQAGPSQEDTFLSSHEEACDESNYGLPLSPRQQSTFDSSKRLTTGSELYGLSSSKGQNPNITGNESTSWLDTIDESGPSSPTSTKSKLSLYSRNTHSRPESNGTEAEFDAALDAAVEAAYNEGLEPASHPPEDFYENDDDVVSNARRNIEIAKQRVREAEREAQEAMARGLEKRRMNDEALWSQNARMESDYVGEEAEEEERLLEEMTRGYVMDDFELDLHTKSALPRQSDSSTFSARTWGSSLTSNAATAVTSLSTLAEEGVLSSENPAVPGTRPPMPLPQSVPLSPPSGVRARRLSGSNMKQLKIDTNRIATNSQPPKTEPYAMPFRSPPPPMPQFERRPNIPVPPHVPSKSPQNMLPERKASYESLREDSYGSGLTRAVTQDSDDFERPIVPSPPKPIGKITSAPGILRKNTSSSSLGAMMARNMSVSTPDISTESPNTPSSSTFPAFDFQRGGPNAFIPALPTPTAQTFTVNSLPGRGLYLFNSDIHSPSTPGSPNHLAANAPLPLEPCPESFLLRPFWLMRSLYETIAHPRGGYLSTKLFVPREVWRVKNVKIRGVEDKISLCDLLTAALLKLAQVDTYDADAVLEEMQSFENILDQVQSTFSKKLGNEVGVQGTLALIKSASTSDDASMVSETISRSSNSSSKSYLSSWRKLRSKSSGPTGSSATPIPTIRETGKESLTMNTLPMTTSPSTRIVKRNVTQLQFTGPNANYIGALARLFDAVQVLGKASTFPFSVLASTH
ncbi:hypothetical protein BGW36DRAFT_178069 [Talaromyces proteolyticus]|uniref:MIT domain-containing protein n=1 Tax=Talaromyces proteolyticus TaxID=1131652 RepID=A0AAD4KM70_9EURO|nr:uncharacterized protein BGW36DRAFT_178069 [Talaromyces proteolyticus]KAH8695908.1 hypothetical protein BGW36DRAFT_178069 [Talaromyces proteolyticus]